MTEDEARSWLTDILHVPRETIARIESFIAFLFIEAEKQNLISASTRDQIWSRHIVDSAQLVPMSQKSKTGPWVDLGSGAGFPGLLTALLTQRETILIESRRKRVLFLEEAVRVLGIEDIVSVEGRRVEMVQPINAAVISARAFAPLGQLFDIAARFSHTETLWLLPKGRNTQSELDEIRKTWHGVFHVEQSVTDSDSTIIVARELRKAKI